MKLHFPKGNPQEIITQIEDKLDGRKLGKIVRFTLSGHDLEVTIKKVGTSSLFFMGASTNGGFDWVLEKEKIALAHKAFRSEMLKKIAKIVDQIGGKMIDGHR